MIQTISPENQIIRHVCKNDYEAMFLSQLNERKQFQYPPFNRLINITLKHKNKETLDIAAREFVRMLKHSAEFKVIGPEYPVIAKIYELFLKNILVKLERNNSISSNKKFILETGRELLKKSEFKSVQIVYDVDPY